MIKYKTNRHFEIRAFEVTKETAKQVVYMEPGIFNDKLYERREAKRSDYHQWHDTWEAAHRYLLDKASMRVLATAAAHRAAQEAADRIRAMVKPETADA